MHSIEDAHERPREWMEPTKSIASSVHKSSNILSDLCKTLCVRLKLEIRRVQEIVFDGTLIYLKRRYRMEGTGVQIHKNFEEDYAVKMNSLCVSARAVSFVAF